MTSQARFPFWQIKRKPRLLSHAPGADVFRAHGCIIAWNSRLSHWCVRRDGKIVGDGCPDIKSATELARATAKGT